MLRSESLYLYALKNIIFVSGLADDFYKKPCLDLCPTNENNSAQASKLCLKQYH
jgi:hypothetical protein